MEIEFGPAKDALNRKQHGVSLAFGRMLWDDEDMLVLPTIRIEDEEARFKAIAMVGERLWTAIYVVRGEKFRFISVRKSNASEQRLYDWPAG
ncbi:MAG: BrnT family toxin [Sphingobium sp.]